MGSKSTPRFIITRDSNKQYFVEVNIEALDPLFQNTTIFSDRVYKSLSAAENHIKQFIEYMELHTRRCVKKIY